MALDLNASKGTYVASTWKDGTDDYTPITPDKLNHIEQGIQANSNDIKTLGSAVDSIVKVQSIQKSITLNSVATGYEFTPTAISGYTPIGVIGFNTSNQTAIPYRIILENGVIKVGLSVINNASLGGSISFVSTVLYMKNV